MKWERRLLIAIGFAATWLAGYYWQDGRILRLLAVPVLQPMPAVRNRLPEVHAGQPVDIQLLPLEGKAPWSFVLAKGQLPPGLRLDGKTGHISGTIPAGKAGRYDWDVAITDADGHTVTQLAYGTRY